VDPKGSGIRSSDFTLEPAVTLSFSIGESQNRRPAPNCFHSSTTARSWFAMQVHWKVVTKWRTGMEPA